MRPTHVRHSLFYGWWIVGAGFWIWMLTGGFVILGFTAFFEPITNEFGWSYTQVSLAASFRGVELGLFAPILGLLIDRWGPRRLVFAGILLGSIGLLLLSRVGSLGMFYMVFGLMAVSTSLFSPTVIFTPIANWFHKKLGMATGIAGSGFALGGLLVPLVVVLIDRYGWRMTLLVLGLSLLVLCLPLALVFRHKPEPYGYLPDGEPPQAVKTDLQDPAQLMAAAPDMQIKQALRSRPFWHIGLAMMLHTVAITTIPVHIMPFLSSIGISRAVGALLAMAVPLVSIPGRLISGWLADRLDKKKVAAAFFGITALGLLAMSYADSGALWLLAPFIVLYGLGWGSNHTLRTAMLRDYFGRSKFGSIFGLMMGLSAVGGVAGPLLAGWVFDTWASYQYAWLALTALLFISIIVMATTPPVSRYQADGV